MKRYFIPILGVLMICLNTASAYSQIVTIDTVKHARHLRVDTTSVPAQMNYNFSAQQLIAPVTLIGLGTAGLLNPQFREVRNNLRDQMTKMRGDMYIRVDDYLQYVPTVAFLGAEYLGAKPHHTMRERLAVGLTAYAVIGTLVYGGKYTTRDLRPDGSKRNSFPSGHTAVAFVGAELVREEYGLKLGLPAYLLASGVGFLRMYNNRHWINDVFAGAGVGILGARVGYWMLPVYRRWFNWNNQPSEPMLTLVPGYTPETKSVNLGLTYIF